MELTINNQLRRFPEQNLSIQDLMNIEMAEKQSGIAVAVNNTVIPKVHWANHNLSSSDSILIITATQGG